ncbi:MAG: ISAs1 family transposase, partial [Acidimicrobiia bacterium]|nr:ISAs1 family transposase [Acidimicrobiia bacterium]
MRDAWFAGLNVAPIGAGDRSRFDAELDEHHWLGHRMVGETMRYAAVDATGEWVALIGFASPALSCGPRDRFIGWSPEVQLRRLRFVASNQRFCILPAGRRQNTASAVMSRTLRRLSADWVEAWGHRVLLVETFVDPARHVGTCYGASSFLRLGETAGFGRRSGRYVAHGQVKDIYVRALHQRSLEVLAATFDHPLLADPRNSVAQIDFNTADLSSLIERIETITDPRDPRGVRHRFASTLVLVACATLAGHKSLVALSEWCDSSSQEVLARLGARISPSTGLRIPPSYATIRRATIAVDADDFDLIVNTWAAEQADRRGPTRSGADAATNGTATNDDDDTTDPDPTGSDPEDHRPNVGADLVGVAVDSKAVRGAKRTDGTQVQLLAALRHDTGMVIGQANVENDKTNEILAFAPLIETLDLAGRVVTADAMHTQKNAAKLVAGKGSHFIFGVKKNQPKLWNAAVEAGNRIDIDRPGHETCHRGHGRIDRHRVWTAPVPATTQFPYASRYVIVERESSTLDDTRVSIETRFYVTDLTNEEACVEHLLRLVRGHWSIESLHWVRDNTFDEDRSQVRTGTLPRVLATLRNLAIGIIRHTTYRT